MSELPFNIDKAYYGVEARPFLFRGLFDNKCGTAAASVLIIAAGLQYHEE